MLIIECGKMTVKSKQIKTNLPRKKRRKWTPTKLRYLEKYVPHMSYTDIADRINMPPSSVRAKAIQLGIQRDHCVGYYKDEFGDYYQWNYKRQKWTEEDKQYLRKNHNKFLVVELARILNRKYNSVYQQLRVMGYTPLTTKDWRVVFDRYLKEVYLDRANPLLLYKLYGEKEVLQQVQSLLNRIHDIALAQHVSPLIVHSLLLRAKFSLVEGNAQQANSLLEKAKLTTIESGLDLMGTMVTKEQEQLQSELAKWTAFIQSNTPLKERLELARLKDYIAEALKFIPKT